MAQYKLVPSDVTAALAEQNIESATGTLGENSDNAFQYTMKYRGRYQTPEEFGEIVLLAKPDGTLLRLKDVADIELGSESYAYKGYTNGHPGVSAMVYQTAGSNATQVVTTSTHCSTRWRRNCRKASPSPPAQCERLSLRLDQRGDQDADRGPSCL